MKNYLTLLFLLCFGLMITSPTAEAMSGKNKKVQITKHEFRQLKHQLRNAMHEYKQAKKAAKRNPEAHNVELGRTEWLGITVMLVGLAGGLVASVLGLGWLAGVLGTVVLVGLIIFLLSLFGVGYVF